MYDFLRLIELMNSELDEIAEDFQVSGNNELDKQNWIYERLGGQVLILSLETVQL